MTGQEGCLAFMASSFLQLLAPLLQHLAPAPAGVGQRPGKNQVKSGVLVGFVQWWNKGLVLREKPVISRRTGGRNYEISWRLASAFVLCARNWKHSSHSRGTGGELGKKDQKLSLRPPGCNKNKAAHPPVFTKSEWGTHVDGLFNFQGNIAPAKTRGLEWWNASWSVVSTRIHCVSVVDLPGLSSLWQSENCMWHRDLIKNYRHGNVWTNKYRNT